MGTWKVALTCWLTNSYFPAITPLFVFILKARTAVLSYLSAEKAKQTLRLPKLSEVYGDPMWLWKCCSQKYVVFLSSPSRILNSRCCYSFIRLALTGRMSNENILSVILLSADWTFLFFCYFPGGVFGVLSLYSSTRRPRWLSSEEPGSYRQRISSSLWGKTR